MLNFMSKLIFITTLITGSFIAISSSSWIGMWIGLEINLLSFIPLMIDTNNLISTESAIKYFLIQAFASLIFLFTAILYITKFNFFFNFLNFWNENMIINSTMILKLGGAPFHFWFPSMIDGLTWMNTLILLTWQKLAPLMIISYSMFETIIIMFILFSTLVGSIGGLNQTSLRKILVFSSINHIGWLITAIFYSNILWLFYFLVYFMINLSIIMIFKAFNLFNINQMYLFNNSMPIMKFCFLMNFMSLGGLPPFLGFFPKWMIIENMIKTSNLFILTFIVMTALITLFFYIRLTFSAFLLTYPSFSWNYSNNKKMNLTSANITLNLMMSLLLASFMINSYYLI